MEIIFYELLINHLNIFPNYKYEKFCYMLQSFVYHMCHRLLTFIIHLAFILRIMKILRSLLYNMSSLETLYVLDPRDSWVEGLQDGQEEGRR